MTGQFAPPSFDDIAVLHLVIRICCHQLQQAQLLPFTLWGSQKYDRAEEERIMRQMIFFKKSAKMKKRLIESKEPRPNKMPRLMRAHEDASKKDDEPPPDENAAAAASSSSGQVSEGPVSRMGVWAMRSDNDEWLVTGCGCLWESYSEDVHACRRQWQRHIRVRGDLRPT